MREPLPGWVGVVSPGGDGRELAAGPIILRSYRKTWAIEAAAESGVRVVIRNGGHGGRLAAEDAARALLDELADALGLAVRAGDCVWTWDDADCYWSTACGEAITFEDGGLADNECRFCHGCGGAIATVPYQEDEAGE